MLKKLLLISAISLLVLAVFSAPSILAQDPDDGAASKGEVLSDPGDGGQVKPPLPPFEPPPPAGLRDLSGAPLGKSGSIDLANLPALPNGQMLPNLESLKQQKMALANSLTAEQRAQIKALLDANPPLFMETVKATLGNPAVTGVAAQPSLEQVQAMDKAGRQWVDSINAGLKAILTPEQAAAFESTRLPHPAEWAASLGISPADITPQTYDDCYTAYYYSYYYSYYYTLYAYYYAEYFYYSYSTPAAYSIWVLALDTFYATYYGSAYAYYATAYYYDATYAIYAWYYLDHASYMGEALYPLAYDLGYYWTGSDYAYYTYLYSYHGYIFNFFADYFAFYCYVD